MLKNRDRTSIRYIRWRDDGFFVRFVSFFRFVSAHTFKSLKFISFYRQRLPREPTNGTPERRPRAVAFTGHLF